MTSDALFGITEILFGVEIGLVGVRLLFGGFVVR